MGSRLFDMIKQFFPCRFHAGVVGNDILIRDFTTQLKLRVKFVQIIFLIFQGLIFCIAIIECRLQLYGEVVVSSFPVVELIKPFLDLHSHLGVWFGGGC